MILIALGANLPSQAGPPEDTLWAALGLLALSGCDIGAVSRVYRTPAWPDPADPPFANAVARLHTRLAPSELLGLMHGIETSFGRERSTKNAPRTLDLDLLDYHGFVDKGPPDLPHPRLRERAFVLYPLGDVAPGWTHPATRESLPELIAALPIGAAPDVLG